MSEEETKKNNQLGFVLTGIQIGKTDLIKIIQKILINKIEGRGEKFEKPDIKRLRSIINSYGEYIGTIDYIASKWNGKRNSPEKKELLGVKQLFKENFGTFYEKYKNQDVTSTELLDILIDIAKNKATKKDNDPEVIKELIANIERLMDVSKAILDLPEVEVEKKVIEAKTPDNCKCETPIKAGGVGAEEAGEAGEAVKAEVAEEKSGEAGGPEVEKGPPVVGGKKKSQSKKRKSRRKLTKSMKKRSSRCKNKK